MNTSTTLQSFKQTLLALLGVALITGAQAGTQYASNSITWNDNSTAAWSTTSGGPYTSVWNAGDDAVFEGTAGTVTLDNPTARNINFNVTGYILSGASTLTLSGTTPTITVGAGIAATIGNNTGSVIGGVVGLTLAGAGALTNSSSAVSTFTGGLTLSGSTLVLNPANLGTPTDLINSGNALNIYNGGTLNARGKSGTTAAQTFNGLTVYTGNATIGVTNSGANASSTNILTLGTIAQAEIGGVVSMGIMPVGTIAAAPTLANNIIKVSNTGNSYIGPWAIAGDSKGTTGRWGYVTNFNGNLQVITISGTAAGGVNMTNVANDNTVYTIAGNHTLTTNRNAYAIQDNDTANNSVTMGAFNITNNGISQIRGSAYTRSFIGSTGGGIVVGAANELVMMGIGSLNMAVPIYNGTAGNSHVTYAGGGTLLINTNTGTYSGKTTINSGTVRLGAYGSINTSTEININGGKFVQTNATTPVTVTVNLKGGAAGGTVDGTSSIKDVVVSDLAANVIANGDGGTTPLTITNLTFNGKATVTIRTAGSAGIAVPGTLVTTPASGKVTINVSAGPAWVAGNTYNLISYGTWGGNLSDFQLGTVAGLAARQNANLVLSGNNIALQIGGDNALWTGVASGDWTTNAIGSPYNWKLQVGGTDTEFLTGDSVVFDDTALGTTNINISSTNVYPTSTTFNITNLSYSVSSSGGFGIASGFLTKTGSGTLSLNSSNSYSGSTAINGGTVQVSGGNAIANNGVVALADASGASLQVVATETIGALSGGGASGGSVTIDAGQALTLAGGTQTHAGAIGGLGSLTNAGATQTLNGNLSQGGDVTVASGVLTLGSSGNSYAGATTVGTGAGLVVSANNALGATTTGTTVSSNAAVGFSSVIYTAQEKITGSGPGNLAALGVFSAVQRGFVQGVSGSSTNTAPIEMLGSSRFGIQNGARLTLSGPITMASGVSNVTVLFRGGENDGDFVTLANNGNVWDTDTQIYTGNANASQYAGLRLGVDNALPTTVGVSGAASGTPGITLDLNGYNQTVAGLQGVYQLKIVNLASSGTSILTLNGTNSRSTTVTSISDGPSGGKVALVKSGSFQQTLGATNNYTGTTIVNEGALVFTKPAALYNGNAGSWMPTNITVESGATLGISVGGATEFLAADVASLLSGLSTVNNNGLKAGSYIGFNVTAPFTNSTVVTDSTGTGGGSVGINKLGGSTLTLDQNNTFSGGILFNAGYITATNNGNALGAGSITFGSGANRLNLWAGYSYGNSMIMNVNPAGAAFYGSIHAWGTGDATLNGNMTLNGAPLAGGHFGSETGARLVLNGTITSTNRVTLRTGSIQFNTSGSSYPEFSISGVASLGADNGVATDATVSMGLSEAGTFDLAGFNQTVAGLRKDANAAIIGNSSTNYDSTLTVTGSAAFDGVIQDSVGVGTRKVNLVKSGAGSSLVLSNANPYTGNTTISAGTLALTGAGTISGTPVISVDSSASFDVAGVTGGFVLGSGQTLTGSGSVAGDVTANGTLIPGSSIGTLTFSNNLVIGGNLVFDLKKGQAQSNDLIHVLGATLTNAGAGTLTVSNLGPALVVGDTFKLFSQPVANGLALNIVGPDGVTFTNKLEEDGSIAVLTVPQTIPPVGTNLSFSLGTPGQITLSWPSNYLGAYLQMQTNGLNTGLSNNWVTIPGSESVTSTNLPLTKTDPTVFFRMVHTNAP